MADNKQALELLFKVAGGSSISGETGKLISGQLEELSKKIKLKLRVDEEYFSKQVDKLKADIQKKIGTVEVNFKTKEVSTGKSSGKASSSTQKDTAAEESFKRAKKYLVERQKIQKQLNKLDAEGFGKETKTNQYGVDVPTGKVFTNQFKVLDAQFKEADRNFKSAKVAAGDYGKTLDALQNELTETATAQKALFKSNIPEQTRSASIGFKGVVANVKTLGERYSDIIKTNKKAADAWKELQKLADAPWKGKNYKDDKGNNIKGSLAAGKKQTQELAKSLKDTAAQFAQISKESDTFGGKIKEAFSTKLVQYFAAALSGILIRALNQVYQNVVKLDAAITDLQVATGKSRKETGELVKQYAELAKQLGATVLEVTDAADTWLRQGYDVADTNELITSTLMLSKLGQIDAAEAAKALTSAMKGYKKEVADASSIVDKFTAVDMRAAVSAGDIATAMAETATGADIAGVSMDKLIGYIATVAEVTQDGAESVGKRIA